MCFKCFCQDLSASLTLSLAEPGASIYCLHLVPAMRLTSEVPSGQELAWPLQDDHLLIRKKEKQKE